MGKHELVPSPADADIVFEIHSYDSREAGLQVHLAILDPKTHITLWSITHQVDGASRSAIARKNLEESMNALVEDLKKLVTGTP